jgi:outer membrane protein assembly factor BamB
MSGHSWEPERFVCCDFEGNEVWRANLSERFGPFDIAFGMSSTPVLHGERVFFQFIHGDGDASTHEALVVALDKKTGRGESGGHLA